MPPPRPGLVPQTGDPAHPGHWVRPDAGAPAPDNRKADSPPRAGAGRDLVAAWKGQEPATHASTFAAAPGWVDDLAELLHRDPRLADWRQAVFLTALAGGAVDPAEAVRLAAAAPLPTTRPVRTP